MDWRDTLDSDFRPTPRLTISKPGESVQLQQLGIGDSSALFDLVEADRSHFVPFATDFADTIQDVNDAITSIARTSPDRLRFGIWEGGHLRGESILMFRADARAEVSYWIGAEHTQKGYATRAQQLLGSWSFESARLTTLYATIHVDNIASRGVAENAGFIPDEQQDEIIRYIKVKSNPRTSPN
jgi:RimJ/RimL family protein N-acetyltransferase